MTAQGRPATPAEPRPPSTRVGRASPDALLTEHLDEDWILSCEFSAHTGDEVAAWVLFPSCCSVNGRAYILGCDSCKARKTAAVHCVRCDVCDARYVPAPRGWRRIEPIQ